MTSEDLDRWKTDPITKEVIRRVREHAISRKPTLDLDSMEKTALSVAYHYGYAEGIEQLSRIEEVINE